MCKYCENGKINKLGEEWFQNMPFEIIGNISHNRPVIFKTNGKYFMKVENFSVLEVIACPMCGASFETPVLSTDEENVITVGDVVRIVEGPDASVYRENEFEVLSEPYEIGGEIVVKMKCHKTGKYFGGGYTTKYLKKVKKEETPPAPKGEKEPPSPAQPKNEISTEPDPAGDSSSMTQNDMAVPDAEV
ncbi:MAG: hypothetical protein IJN40_05085 [Clostridia bacterium]|nr:hypothetical protein [Clostridia bacterium]